jgi:hypothetical protein
MQTSGLGPTIREPRLSGKGLHFSYFPGQVFTLFPGSQVHLEQESQEQMLLQETYPRGIFAGMTVS